MQEENQLNYILSLLLHGAGILACLDGYMNIAMEQTEEYVNGQLKNKYGDAFIRGNNGKANKLVARQPLISVSMSI